MLPFNTVFANPVLGANSFTVTRRIYTHQAGELVLTQTTQTTASGCIHPASAEELKLLPTGADSEDTIVIYTPFALSLGGNTDQRTFAAPDEITWNNETWRLIRTQSWPMFGFTAGYAVRQKGVLSP